MSSFDPFPTLETPRLVLRELALEDAETLFPIRTHPAVMQYLGRDPDPSIEAVRKKLEQVVTGVREGTSIRWGITLRGSGELLGSGGFWRWEVGHRWAEIGYELAPSHWGRGLMTEALRAILRHGFTEMGLHRVEANIDPANEGSRRVLEKLGFSRDGLIRENWLYNGSFIDSGVYGLLAREFEENERPVHATGSGDGAR